MSDEHGAQHYIRIWAILLGLLVVSVAGPMLEIQVVTLITAFGIALVKAYLVCKNFMHLNVQPKFVIYLLTTMLVFMLLFFAGTAPDVMKHEGHNWVKTWVEPVSDGETVHH
jgi:caa(3)-type oxidase subunit IV